MAVIGTFSSFTAARLGIYASQASLQVTGNNIANINTKGYTRQRADLISLNSTGTSKYASGLGVDVGYGVLVRSTTQLRDPYLDIRFRNQNTKLGEVNATLAGLNKIAQTLDEVNKGGESQNGVIENALQNFKTMLEGLANSVGSEEQDGLVREAAKSLVTFFNTAAEELQNDWDLQADEMKDTIKDVNKCLTNIRDLNEQIRKQGIYGDNALELRDQRNLYIDELSEYLNINVEYSMERIDQYTEVEKLTISLANTKDPRTGLPIKIIDGLFGAQLSLSELEVNPNYEAAEPRELRLNPQYDPKVTDKDDIKSYKYIKEDGKTGTNDPEEADWVMLNPLYTTAAREIKRNPEAVAWTNEKGEYLNADKEVVENPDDALWVKRNPAFNEDAPASDENPRYLGEDGKPINNIEKAEKADRYMNEEGKPTDDPELAVYWKLNPQYKPDELKLPVPNEAFLETDEAKKEKYEEMKDPENEGAYLDENGNSTTDKNKAALVRLNPAYVEGAATEPEKFQYLKADGTGTENWKEAITGEYLDEEGKPTNDLAKANYVKQNPAYDAEEHPDRPKYLDVRGRPTNDIKRAVLASRKYMKADGTTTNYVEDATEAPRKYLVADPDGKPEKDEDGNLKTTNYIGKAPSSSRKYIAADPADGSRTTNIASEAAKVDVNKFLFQVERLEDKLGRPLNEGVDNKADKKYESVVVPLGDNDLAGSLQAMRELLTEEGEFASLKDVGAGKLSYSEERAADHNANIKKGIPYYQKRLDLMAQKFAEVFNEANQLPASTAYKTAPAPIVGNETFKDADGNDIMKVGADGKPTNDSITMDDVTVEVDGKRVLIEGTDEVRKALAQKIRAEAGNENLSDDDVKTKVEAKITEATAHLKTLKGNGIENESVLSRDDPDIFIDDEGKPITDSDGKTFTVDDVTVEINGERVPLMDTKEVRDALRAMTKTVPNPDYKPADPGDPAGQADGDPADPVEPTITVARYTEKEIDEKIANSAKYLEALRDKGVVDEAYGHYDGGVLFSNSGNNNNPSNITARSISISNGWASRVVRVLNRTKPNEVTNDGSVIDHSSDNSNILHIISLFESQLKYSATELEPDAAGGNKTFFQGSFQEMYTDLGATLGSQQSTIQGIASNYEIMTLELDNDRSSVSGVDLNEEATSMMQFQKSYQAACRLMTTLDSMLDTLINGMLR